MADLGRCEHTSSEASQRLAQTPETRRAETSSVAEGKHFQGQNLQYVYDRSQVVRVCSVLYCVCYKNLVSRCNRTG